MILSITDLDKEFIKQTVDSLKNEKNKKLLEAYHAGDKTAEEIIEFIRSGKPKMD